MILHAITVSDIFRYNPGNIFFYRGLEFADLNSNGSYFQEIP